MRLPRNGDGRFKRRHRRRRLKGRHRLALVLAAFAAFVALPLVFPSGTANAVGICDLSADLAPEVVGGGVDGLIQPPAADSGASGAEAAGAERPRTTYERYGMAGQFWHTYDLGCADVAAVLGNAWANTVFSWAKAVDRLTISTYEAAATEGPLQPIKDVADDIVTNLADAMYWPFLRPIVILAAIWLAWFGLIRKRATMTTEGVIWMVLAVTVAIWFFSRPGDFTGIGKAVTDKTGEIVNSAFAGLPRAGGASCLPPEDPGTGGYGRSDTPGVAQNADALWSTLVCKPWLMGEFGDNKAIADKFGAKLLDLQAIDRQEQAANQLPSGDAHQKRFEEEIAKPLENTPVFYLLQGKDWTSRLGIAIGAFIAAMVAGLLIFLVAVSLLVLKVGFLLLLMLAPVFLLIGVHPGSGRIIAMRWLEMVIGTLLRQAVLALVLGILVYGYALIISTDLPWGMQILFIALLTIAVFFYRRPFQHLFASMDGHTLTTRMLGEAATAPTLSRAAGALPPVAAARVGRWGLRKAEPVLGAAAMAAGAGAATAVAAGAAAQGRARAEEAASAAAGRAGAKDGAQPAPLETDPQAAGRRKAGAAPRPGSAPPLNLSGVGRTSSRPGSAAGPSAGARAVAGAASGAGSGATSGATSANGSSGGWFSGRSGGWASRGGSASRRGSTGRSGGLFGWGRTTSGGASGGLFGGGLFGGSFGGRNAPKRGSEARPRSAPPRAGSGRPRSAEPPPLWLPSRDGGGRSPDDAPVPFWARPVDRDSGD